MQFTEGSFYHIYNRGNNKQKIFFTHENYIFFLNKVKKYIQPNCDILAWTLMPNHFHFLIRANEATVKSVKHTPIMINSLTEGIRLLLSSYAKAIQRQESVTGNLFQQKTKAKCVDDYLPIAFHYIHQNALRAGLCKQIENWEFSSVHEYLNSSTHAHELCFKPVAFDFINIDQTTFLKDSHEVLNEDEVNNIFSY